MNGMGTDYLSMKAETDKKGFLAVIGQHYR